MMIKARLVPWRSALAISCSASLRILRVLARPVSGSVNDYVRICSRSASSTTLAAWRGSGPPRSPHQVAPERNQQLLQEVGLESRGELAPAGRRVVGGKEQ